MDSGGIMSFKKYLEDLINRHSKENESNTPDFILASYINDCLRAFNLAVQQRETWHGRDARPTSTISIKASTPDPEKREGWICTNCGRYAEGDIHFCP